jgi:enolase
MVFFTAALAVARELRLDWKSAAPKSFWLLVIFFTWAALTKVLAKEVAAAGVEAHAAARAKQMPLYAYLRFTFDLPSTVYRLPLPTMNVLNGGAHAGWILDFQEFMIVPLQKKFRERVRCGAEVFHELGKLLKKKGFSTLKGDEGGYAVALKTNEEAFKLIMIAIKSAGYVPGKDVMLAMDPAVSEFYNDKTKRYELKREGKSLTSSQMIAMWERWVKKYPIVSLEDGLDQDDWDGWIELTKRLGKKIVLVGDDFLVTNAARLAKAIEMKAGNAILIKVNRNRSTRSCWPNSMG